MNKNLSFKKLQPNYELKARVIENGCANLQKKLSLASWKYNQALSEFKINGDLTCLEKASEIYDKLHSQLENYSFEDLEESKKVNNAGYHRVKRLSDRVLTMLKEENCIFLTLTFRNDVLANTSSETRAKYIKRFLKEQCSSYVANIDFGRKNEREHYHAVVVPKGENIDGAFYRKNYGSIDFERVRNKKSDNNEDTSKRLAKYVNKLTNHAIKETVRQNRVIYSRG